MGKILILNASPRAPKSNSKHYAQIFSQKCRWKTEYENISKTNHLDLCEKIGQYSDLLFVFPLYADGIPVTLLNFLKSLSEHPPKPKPVISVLINCGFLEPHQNNIAVEMIRLFCKESGYEFGSVFKIGSGEAILTTPFRLMVTWKMKKFARSVTEQKYQILETTMPISKQTFLKASTSYWTAYGEKNGISKEQMETMEIES
jgi:hypothetical protein